jgi:signal transduction histidine kinase
MLNSAAIVPEEGHFILARLPPGPAQRRLALAVVLALLIAFFVAAGPLSTLQSTRIDAFVPAYATALIVIDLITSILLFAQFSIVRSHALLVIANGYLYTALIVIPWMLTFPGAFAPNGLLGAGLQTTNWLYILWHVGFPMFIMAFALLSDTDSTKVMRNGSAGAAIASSAAATTAVVCAATFLLTRGGAHLPRTMLDSIHFSPLRLYIAVFQVVLCVAALFLLSVRRHSMLSLWLMVVMCAYAIEVCLIAFPVPARFSFGWYAGRIFGLVSGSLVLFVLLYETTALYRQVLWAVLAQRREREARLVAGDAIAATIAHEVKQPLAAMLTSADAGFLWLDRAPPDIEKARAAFKRISADGHRAGGVIESIRAIFKKDLRNRTAIDVNELVRKVLTLAGDDLQRHRIAVRTETCEQLPQIMGDQIQLQQVLLNLISNAIDSMATKDEPRLLCLKSDVIPAEGVKVSLADTGTGIEPHDCDRIFDPLFTKKSGGMGMGLFICRSIIEAHNGRIWVAPNKPDGTVFQFVLPHNGQALAHGSREEQAKGLSTNAREESPWGDSSRHKSRFRDST